MAGSSKRLKQKGKIRSLDEEDDRVSDLPDGILHHVLSFLETKFMVRTSLLSKRWRSLWKDVPALNFGGLSFNSESNSREYVSKALSLRSDSAAVSSVTFEFGETERGEQVGMTDLFGSVMRYAASHGMGELGLGFLQLYCWFSWNRLEFSGLASSITAHRHHESLKTLKLKRCRLDGELGLGFKLLSTLELSDSYFCFRESASGMSHDPFADLPCLNYLKLLRCSSSKFFFKVSGLQLLDLEIQEPGGGQTLDVFAPKLKHFLFQGAVTNLGKLDLPSLDCANIRVRWEVPHWSHQKRVMQRQMDAYIKLLRELHNATSLCLRFDKHQRKWKEDEFPFNSMKLLLEPEASPFTRLKILRVQYPQDPPITPYQVIRYFFEGSPNIEEKFVKFERKIK
ncbi:unnamed protein product [Linum tenue]|uniref:F-box domain-containing protein n=1 Tax=Linum tenue TaxID=586396 RepID=A0AAV0M3F8_9ROSI|nr:unnamed protein product [Linum tenue]